jgi:hypothetical protein
MLGLHSLCASRDLGWKPSFAFPAATHEKNCKPRTHRGQIAVDGNPFLGRQREAPLYRCPLDFEEFSKFQIVIQFRDVVAVGGNMQIVKDPIHFLTIGSVEAETKGSARVPTHDAAFQMALEIQYQIELSGTNLCEKGQERLPAAIPIENKNFVDPGISFEQRKTSRFNRPSQECLRKPPTQQVSQGQGAGNVADGTVENDEKFLWIEPRRPTPHGKNSQIHPTLR